MSTSISLSSGNNVTICVTILQCSPSKEKCNLGAWLVPDGNNKADLDILYSKGRSMSMHIAVSQLKWHKVAIAYKMMLCPAIKSNIHSAVQLCPHRSMLKWKGLTFPHYYSLGWVLAVALSKLSFLDHPPLVPLDSQTHAQTKTLHQAQLLLDHLHQDADIGKLMQIVMENLQLVIGDWRLDQPSPCSNTQSIRGGGGEAVQFCSCKWLLNVWDFVLSIGGRLYLERAWLLEAQQVKSMMYSSWTISFPITPTSPKPLKCLNACQSLLKVLTLADITDGSGSQILKCSLNSTRQSDRRSSYRWSQQVYPSSAAAAAAAWNIFGAKVFPYCSAAPVHPTNCINHLVDGTTLGPYTRNGHTLLTCLHSACFIFQKQAKVCIFWCYFPVHSSWCFTPRAQSPFLTQWQLYQSQLLIKMMHSSQSLPVSPHSHGYTHQSDCTSLMHRPITLSLPQHLSKHPLALWSAMGHCFFPTNISDLVAEYSN